MAGLLGEAIVSASDPFSVDVNNYSLFAQDTWRARNNLTITYGLRWEINPPPTSATPGQPALYSARNLRLESSRSSPWGPLAHEAGKFCSAHRSRLPDESPHGAAGRIWSLL